MVGLIEEEIRNGVACVEKLRTGRAGDRRKLGITRGDDELGWVGGDDDFRVGSFGGRLRRWSAGRLRGWRGEIGAGGGDRGRNSGRVCPRAAQVGRAHPARTCFDEIPTGGIVPKNNKWCIC